MLVASLLFPLRIRHWPQMIGLGFNPPSTEHNPLCSCVCVCMWLCVFLCVKQQGQLENLSVVLLHHLTRGACFLCPVNEPRGKRLAAKMMSDEDKEEGSQTGRWRGRWVERHPGNAEMETSVHNIKKNRGLVEQTRAPCDRDGAARGGEVGKAAGHGIIAAGLVKYSDQLKVCLRSVCHCQPL